MEDERRTDSHESAEARVAKVTDGVWVAWLCDADGHTDPRCPPGCGRTGAEALRSLRRSCAPQHLRLISAAATAWTGEDSE